MSRPRPDLHATSDAFKAQKQEYTQSGKYYVTAEINRELAHLENGVNHIRLDHDFVTTDKAWGDKWRPRGAERERAEADNAMYQAANIVGYTKNHMNARDIAGMQDNQVRQRHHEAIDNLRGGEQGMAPFAHHSIDRLKQYADYAGVTDRYTGYRNNLNRGSQEAGRMGPSWVDHQTQYNPYNSPSRTPRCQNGGGPQFDYGGPSPTCNRGWPDEAQKCCTKAASNPRNCADSAGINTSFPGMSWGYS